MADPKMTLQKATYTQADKTLVTELVYANHADLEQATASVVIRMKAVRRPDAAEFHTAKAEALYRARDLLNAETDGI